MSDGQPTLTAPGSIGRRRFLKVSGAAVAGRSLLTMLDARQAPAQLNGTTLRILTWSHFIPAYDVWFDKFSAEWGEKNGVKVRVDHIPHLEIPARMAAEFAAGAGHDIILNNSTILARLYYKSLLDMTDTYDQLGKKYGGWIPAAKSPIEVEGRIYGIPMYYILLPMLWRKDLFEANGLKPPDTWELARVAARTSGPRQSFGIAFPTTTTRTSAGDR
jgi:multiple sugar transport system substrate-binding protein